MEGESNNKLDAQSIQAIFQTDESIIFCFDGREESLELRLLADSGLIQEILLSHPPESPSTPLVVTLPKWVTTFIFQALSEFLHNRSLSVITDTTVQLSDQMLQRLLWAGDYFQIEEFQLKCIQEVLIPRIRVQNCLLFINEAFKKLRACENSCDVWYMLLNTGMNFAAKHLLTIFNSNSAELLKTNSKILEEIIERALKYYRKKETLDCAQMIEFILTVRKLPDCFSLLALQRKNLFSKKINYQSHPSISWKLSNLNTIINKETNSFKFNDYQWKLVAKMEDDKQVGKTLRIYLRLENPATAAVTASAGRSRPKTAESEQNPKDSPDGFRKIVSVYFLLRLNQEECAAGFTVKHIVLDKSPQILLLEFQAKQLLASENKRLEFTVYLNTDFVYALVLQYISKSLDQFTKLPEFGTLSEDDILAVLRSLPSTAHHQEKALSIIQLILNQKEQVVSSPIELLKLLDYNSISLNLLVQLQNSPVIRAALPLSKFVDAEVHKKRTGVSSPSWQPQQQQLPSSENKIRDSNRTENYLQGNSPFEVQKRDTEGPADADNFAMHRPESNFRQYLQRNDSQDFRKKTQSQDQFALRRNVSEDSASGSYAFNQGKNQELPSSKLDRFKKTPSNVNSSIKGSGLEFQQQFSVSSSISEQSTAFQASPASFQQNINLKSTGSAQKLQQSTPTNPQAPFAQRSQPQQFSMQQQQQQQQQLQQQQLPQQQTLNQQQQLQQNAGNYSKGISLVNQPQNQISSQQQIPSQQLSQQVISSPPPQSMNRNSPPLPPSRSNQQVHSFVPVDGNPLLIEREMRKRQLLPELDLRKYVLNPQLLLEQNEIFAA